MNTDELIRFNPILAEALAKAEENSDPDVPKDYLRELVAVSVRSGVEPSKIYAVIKTGRILTAENMKLLSKADIKEWEDACREYNRLAGTNGVKKDWEKVLEETWGRALVHESGHALMAALQEIPCRGIYYDKTARKFSVIADLPMESEYTKKHYIFLTASSAAELVTYGNQDEDAAKSDRLAFQKAGAPSIEDTLNEARTMLLENKRKLKRLVSKLKAKCREVDLNLGALPETEMDGSDHKFGILLSKQELEDAVRSK
jgi:hypothetical protein